MLYNKRSSNVASEWPVNIKDRLYNSFPKMVVYNGTVTGLRISAVDGGATESGGAFVDALPSAVTDLVATYPGGLSFEAFDSANRMIRGVLKAAGAGETVGSELLTNPELTTNTTGWTASAQMTIARVDSSIDPGDDSSGHGSVDKWCLKATNGVVSPSFYQAITNSIGMLLKIGTIVYAPSANTKVNCGGIVYGGGVTIQNTSEDAWNTISGYWTPTTANGTIYGNVRNVAGDYTENDIAYFDALTTKRVTAPSASGATIQNGAGLWNFKYKDAAFVYNAASYFCIVKKLR